MLSHPQHDRSIHYVVLSVHRVTPQLEAIHRVGNMKLLALLSAPLAAQGFIFPANRPDGVYSVAIDDKGNALGEPTFLASIPTDTTKLNRRQAPALPRPETNCHNRTLTVGDYSAAFNAFNSICDKAEIYAAYTSLVVSSGSTIAYLCNYADSNRCWSSESNEANRLINSKCGNNGIGWVYVDQYKKSYGRENKGIDICGYSF